MVKSIARRIGTPTLGVITAGVAALTLGSWFVLNQSEFQSSRQALDYARPPSSAISLLLLLPPSQRTAQLEALAKAGKRLDRSRARYLLAADWIEQGQGTKALPWLKGLGQDYPVLAPEILVKQAQAQALAGNQAQATASWQRLLERYPDNPNVAEALYALGQTQPKYWQQAIAQFPAHPRTVEIAQRLLKQNPQQLPLLLLLARHGLYLPEITAVLDRLVKEYPGQLQPQDWEAIAFGYWEKQEYGKAGAAYVQAPQIALNAYRAGRGLQLDQQNALAIAAYKRLVKQFPQTKEAATAWLKLADLAEEPAQALQYLEQAIQISTQVNRPEQTAAALLAKAKLLEQQDQPLGATQTRQQLLSKYTHTDAAAELRWRLATQRAAAQDFATAKKWSWQIAQQNPESELAPQATFWAGKWAERTKQKTEAKQAFKQVLRLYPESYYAWRVASLSGWKVGSFTTVRQLEPTIFQLPQRLELPSGSAALQELYRIGQDQEAWTRWQWEFQHRSQPTASQQLTDGLLRLGVGDYLDGLFMISNLKDRSREEPETAAPYQTWQQQPGYWQALYPLPYVQLIQKWSQQRSLNPLLVTALIRQESRFEPDIRSVAGATGLMQLIPETASWVAPQVNLKRYALTQPQDNVNLGTWYLDYTHRTYDNNSLLAVASYNAGPGNVAEWVQKQGLTDPDEFVEAIPFPETKGYVKAVFENYWNYMRLYNPDIAKLVGQKR